MFVTQYFKNPALLTSIACLVGLSAFSGSANANTIVNGGFEQEITGWEIIGQGDIIDAEFGSGSTEGQKQLLLTALDNEDASSDFHIESFLGLQAGSLDEIAADILEATNYDFSALGNAISGAAVRQRITVKAGDILSFDWNFLTNEETGLGGTIVADFAFFSISAVNFLASELANPLFSLFTPSATTFNSETGFHQHTYQFTTAGTYTLGFGVVNEFDNQAQSGLLIDNISVKEISKSIPEPTSILGLLAVGVIGVTSSRKRQH